MSDSSVQSTAAETPQLSQMERVVDVFTAPSKTFTDIKNGHRNWWLPFLIMVILGYVFFYVVNSKVGMRQVTENQIKMNAKAEEQMQQLPADQREARMKISAYITEGIFVASPVFVILMGIVISAVMLGTINFGFGGKAKFGSVLAVWMYAMMPSVIKTILGIIVIYVSSTPESFNISNFAPTNLGAFLSPTDTNPALYALATSIDVITIWTLVLVGIGTSMVAGVKRSAGYIAAFGWWAVIVLAGVGYRAVAG